MCVASKRIRCKQVLLWLAWGLAVAAVSLSMALGRVSVCDYVSINGDFQSYNVFRRILAGQTPYLDFVNYIGMAPVWINLPLVALNNTFAGSLFATNFTSNLLFSATVLIWVYLVVRRLSAAMVVSAALTKFVSSGLLATVGGPAGAYLTRLFQGLYSPGNSMRIARLFLPFLLAGAALLWLAARGAQAEGQALQRRLADPKPCLLVGGLAGAGLLWSSDFGLATAFSVTVFFLLVQTAHWQGARAFAGRLALYAAGLGAGCLLAACLVTGFHPGAWLSSLGDTGVWQYFYFNGTSGQALVLYVLTNVRLMAFALPYAGLFVFSAVRLVQKRLSDRLFLLAFLGFCILTASGAYVLSGSGYNFKEALEGFLWLGAGALILKALLHLTVSFACWQERALGGTVAVLAVGLAVLAGRDLLAPPPQTGEYLPTLGGATTYHKALVETPALTGGEPVFSLYATGLEAVEGTFQPSGCDYIIHALGADRRQKYLDCFVQGAWRWAQTPRLDVENWLTIQNWDVYRHLWAGYERCYATEYSWLWQAGGDRSMDIEAEVSARPLGRQRWEITVEAPGTEDFTADLLISYESGFTGAGGALLSLGRSLVGYAAPLFGDMPGVGCYLPASGQAYLPVRVEDGRGAATIWSADENFTWLQVEEAEFIRALPARDLYTGDSAAEIGF